MAKPNVCVCESTDVITTNSDRGFWTHCVWCNRSGAWHETLEQSIVDWNQQTAAPELLEACKAMFKAADEIASEFVKKEDAADWGIINEAYMKNSAAIAKAGNK